MAESILFGIAEEVVKSVGSTAIAELASAWGFKAELQKLRNTINTIKDVLLDAEERQADSHAIRGWLLRLTTAVYAADDLFDAFATVVARKQLMGGNKLSMEVRAFFSSSNQIALAFKISHKMKKIRQHLDAIVEDGGKFSFVLRPHEEGRVITNTNRKRNETSSVLDVGQIIGRDADKKFILDLLLDSACVDEDEGFPVISIVGIGGMGKTSLAQLIYNDPQVQVYFNSRLWVCVSVDFDIKEIIKKILMSATNKETPKLEMDQLLGLLRTELGDKKYLLIFDDMWNEKREEWLKLRNLLKIGKKGSKILVTTRSREVAKIMGTCAPHELLGLSEEKSWDLFESMAFEPGQAQQQPNLVGIGKEIVKKCGYVPLAIRVLGSLLFGKKESKWLSIRDTSVANIPESQSDIMNILRISYDNLSSPLKNCFTYCAMFPKDYMFRKEMLIELWVAEGFIVPAANQGLSLEEVAEEYFQILLQRCFFQDIERNEWGDIERCKMHDLIHDLAEDMAGVKCKVAKLGESIFDDRILHLSFAYKMISLNEITKSMSNMKLLRTILFLKQGAMGPFGESMCLQILTTRLSTLRVLDVSGLHLKSLPSSIDKLIHLRYLNLSFTPIEKLPDPITNLWNLQTLRLRFCLNLRELPKDMRKLINLRGLDLILSYQLTHMPSGLEGLTSLNKLPLFIVGHKRPSETLKCKTTSTAKLSDLKNLNNLTGMLEIVIYCNNESNMLEATEAHLSCKHGLTELKISFSWVDDVNCDYDDVVLEGLKPHSNIRDLHINGYRGHMLPAWARMDKLCNTLPNLVKFTLSRCNSCQQLPTLSQLRFLKYLRLDRVDCVEYMEGGLHDAASSSELLDLETIFFPSLEELQLQMMKNLKGWWKGEAIEFEYDNKIEGASCELDRKLVPQFMQFSKLSTMCIWGCPNLRGMLPVCPIVEDLTLRNSNESLSVSKMATTMSSPSVYSWKLKRLTIDNAEDLMFLPHHCLQQLTFLMIIWDRKLESSERLGEVFVTLSSTLKTLEFMYCEKLRSISTGLENLTALEKLKFYKCEELDIAGNEDKNGMPWKALNTSLRSLELSGLPKLVDLPSGLRHLTNLRSLELSNNDELKELPEWISCLTSLENLELNDCPKLNCLPEAFRNFTSLNQLQIMGCIGLIRRCQRPNGSDWPKIQHIPIVSLQFGVLDQFMI